MYRHMYPYPKAQTSNLGPGALKFRPNEGLSMEFDGSAGLPAQLFRDRALEFLRLNLRRPELLGLGFI